MLLMRDSYPKFQSSPLLDPQRHFRPIFGPARSLEMAAPKNKKKSKKAAGAAAAAPAEAPDAGETPGAPLPCGCDDNECQEASTTVCHSCKETPLCDGCV